MRKSPSDTQVVGDSDDISFSSRLYGAFWGYFIGDALSMPCHGYTLSKRIRNDYGTISGYRDPVLPHPQSDLFRARYTPTGPNAEIMHGREKEWRIPGAHYHQYLKGGDNTINVLVGRELLKTTLDHERFDPSAYVEAYTSFFLTPGKNNDTYIPTSHRTFFENYGRGKDPWVCGGESNRIGGLAIALPLALYHARDLQAACKYVTQALSLTHKSEPEGRAAVLMVELLIYLLHGYSAEDALYEHIRNWHAHPALNFTYRRWRNRLSDEEVAEHYCRNGATVDDALPLILFLILKYEGNFEQAALANANLGGDNCPRGAVLGMLAGAAGGCGEIPGEWVHGLSAYNDLDVLASRLVSKVC